MLHFVLGTMNNCIITATTNNTRQRQNVLTSLRLLYEKCMFIVRSEANELLTIQDLLSFKNANTQQPTSYFEEENIIIIIKFIFIRMNLYGHTGVLY